MKVCPICTQSFDPRKMGQKVCSPICLSEWKRQAKITKERKAKLKTRRDYEREAQIEFNKFIRTRDRDLPCISCGRFHSGSFDAGHYRSVGAAPQLRFDEDNCHKQCVPCNQFKSGNAIEYRIRLLERIGVARVEQIERNNEVRKWTIDELKEIKETYKAKTRALLTAIPVSTAPDNLDCGCAQKSDGLD